ncbi:hypothetical protein LINPERHAP2_LOCUS19904 [Linum perenne]
MDQATCTGSQLGYAKLCVALKPLAEYPDSIPIESDEGNTFDVRVDYYNLPKVCPQCIVFGQCSCGKKEKSDLPETMLDEEVPSTAAMPSVAAIPTSHVVLGPPPEMPDSEVSKAFPEVSVERAADEGFLPVVNGRKSMPPTPPTVLSSDFRVAVSYSGKEHFIYLDEALLRWLRDVLQGFMEKGWKDVKRVYSRSGSRSIHLDSFMLREVTFLRILEKCGNGKQFFILLPVDEGQLGCCSWLKSVKSVLLSEKGKGSRCPGFVRSFAEVVGKGAGLASLTKENHHISKNLNGGETTILEVGGDAVEARVRRLKKWVIVCFNLGVKGFVAWGEFQKWLGRWWGVHEAWEKRRLGDDSWLIECESEEAVDRIVERGSWVFRGAPMEVSKWFPEAGRLSSLRIQGTRWVLIFSIPVHLRSDELFREIGKDGRSRFTISVVVEPSCLSEAATGKKPATPSSSSSSSLPVEVRWEVGEPSGKKTIRVPKGVGGPKPVSSCGLAELEFIKCMVSKPLVAESSWAPNGLLCLDLINGEEALGFGALGKVSSGPFILEGSGVGHRTECSKDFVSSPLLISRGTSSATGELIQEGVVEPVLENDVDDDEVEGEKEAKTGGESVGFNEEGEVLVAKGLELAALFDLQCNGSREEAATRVVEITHEVLRRRSKSLPRSKKDLELRRI